MAVLTPGQEDNKELQQFLHLQVFSFSNQCKGILFILNGEAKAIQNLHLR